MEEKKNPVEVLNVMADLSARYDVYLGPQVNKLVYLKEIFREGVLGSEADWSKDYYERLTSGLAAILDDTVEVFDDFAEYMEEEMKKCRATPEFQKYARANYSKSMIKAMEEAGVLIEEKSPGAKNQPGEAIS